MDEKKSSVTSLEVSKVEIRSRSNSCHCCGEVSPYRVFVRGKEEDRNNIIKTFQDCTGIYDELTSHYFCRSCANKILHIKDKIAELREVSKRKKEERPKRGIHDTSPDRSLMSPLCKKAMVSTPPKAKVCLVKKFQPIAPKPSGTLPITLGPSEEPLVKTGSESEAVDQATKEKMRVLPKYLQPRRNEGADVLTHFGLHAKVNLLETVMLWKHIKKHLFIPGFISPGHTF